MTGTLTPGYAADFLVLAMNQPEVLPSWDFEWELVRLYNRDQIEAVVVDGRPVLVEGRATGWDQDVFLHQQLPAAIAAVRGSGALRVHGASSRYRPNE